MLVNRRTVAFVAALVMLGFMVRCGSDSNGTGEAPSPEKVASASASPSAVGSHTFSGTGTKIDHSPHAEGIVTLSGEYRVEWNVKEDAVITSSGKEIDGPFEASLFCEVDRKTGDLEHTEIVNTMVTDGSGEKTISIPKPEDCHINIVTSDTGVWKVTVNRP